MACEDGSRSGVVTTHIPGRVTPIIDSSIVGDDGSQAKRSVCAYQWHMSSRLITLSASSSNSLVRSPFCFLHAAAHTGMDDMKCRRVCVIKNKKTNNLVGNFTFLSHSLPFHILFKISIFLILRLGCVLCVFVFGVSQKVFFLQNERIFSHLSRRHSHNHTCCV